MSRISIAMTTYNGEKFVEKQLLSLLNQTRKADEVIIRDDCSTDKTAEIVSEFIQKNALNNWKFSVNEKNLGYKLNFYNAIKQTSGDIIFLCDQDDIWMPKKLQLMENVFFEHKEIKALNSSFEFMDGEDKTFSVHLKKDRANNNLIRTKKLMIPEELKEIDLVSILTHNISPGCTMAFTKCVKDIYLGKSNCKIVHDWEINFIAASLNGLYFYNVPLIQYHIHSCNVIGLNSIVGKDNSNPADYYVRLERAKLAYETLMSFQDYWETLNDESKIVLKKQKQFVYNRMLALEQKKISMIMKLYSFRRNYKSSITFKGRMADIVCVILPADKEKSI
jgi:rhamnosyltransferase